MTVPRDVREALEKAGVKFDNQGNIIEDDNETFIEIENEDDDEEDVEDEEVLDDDQEEEEDEGDDDDESDYTDDDSEDNEDDDEDEDEDDEEVEEQPKSKKRKPKTKKDKVDESDDDELPKLTPKQLKKQEEDGDEAISEIRKNLKALLEKGRDIKSDNTDNDNDEIDARIALAELRREAEEFRKLRFQAFADNVKTRVNQSNYGAQFEDIINSTQWEEFLNKKAYGSRIGDLYRTAIQSQDANSVLFFFDDFASKYLQKPTKKKESVNKQKEDLDDLAVPDKTKTSGSPKKRKKWDFEEDDYITKLDEAERGIITREEFIKFSDAFESALSKGRVKPSR